MANDRERQLLPYDTGSSWLRSLMQSLNIWTVPTTNGAHAQKKSDDKKAKAKAKIDELKFDVDAEWDKYLKGLDPAEWKEQDHYRCLGLSKKRSHATEAEIKKQYRKIILRHHPDKRDQSKGPVDLNCDYYSCITKAYELLSDPIKRRSYDSIDPEFDNTIANVTPYNKTHFFEVFPEYFERNVRWSATDDAPDIGDEHSTYDEVNDFYHFWYNFDSWREFSYLDEEEKEKGENREERRYLDKQNKAQRQQRKKEESARIRQLVDNAYNCDPRIVQFKETEKKRKLDAKQAKQDAIRARKEEEIREKREKEERILEEKRRIAEEEKRAKDKARKEKDAIKKQMKADIKFMEEIVKNHNYFIQNENERIKNMTDFDKLLQISTPDENNKLRKQFEAIKESADELEELFFGSLRSMREKSESERVKLSTETGKSAAAEEKSAKRAWNYDDSQILVKAVKLFPAGTLNRWNVIATYINEKSTSGMSRDHREVLEKAKELQSSGQNLKEEAQKNAFRKFEETINTQVKVKASKLTTDVLASSESVPSERYDAPATALEMNDSSWSTEEQQLLEQAMRTYPASLGTDRWNQIAECIPGRSRADCIKRYKYLVDMIKAKKAATASVAQKKK